MATTSIEPFLKGDTGRNTRGLLRLIILCTIAAAAVASRLFSVISKFPTGLNPATFFAPNLSYPFYHIRLILYGYRV